MHIVWTYYSILYAVQLHLPYNLENIQYDIWNEEALSRDINEVVTI